MSSRHVLGIDSYQAYVGTVAQHTAVDVGRAAQALTRLCIDADLRRAMGDAGRDRVRTLFDWPVVAAQIRDLVIELGDIRRDAAPFGAGPQRPSHNPVKGNPFQQFAGFASGTMTPDTTLFLREEQASPSLEDSLTRLRSVRLDGFGEMWRGAEAEWTLLLSELGGGPRTVRSLLDPLAEDRRPFAQLALSWLCKLGVLGWR